MNEINLVKKTYEELQDEVIKLTTDKFLLQTKIDKVIEYVNSDEFAELFESYPNLYNANRNIKHILKESGD